MKKAQKIIRVAVVIALCALPALILFAPHNDERIRNVPLLIAVVSAAVLFVLFKLTKRIVFLLKLVSAAKRRGVGSIKYHLLPNLFRKKGRYDLEYVKDANKYQVVLVISRKYIKYHIDDENTLQRFVATAKSVKSGKHSAYISNNVTWKEKSGIFLPWSSDAEAERVIVFSKMPNNITDSQFREQRSIGNGEKSPLGYLVCDIEYFVKHC